MNKNLIATALIPFLLTLTACGGGGSSDEKAPNPDPAPQPIFNNYEVTAVDGYLKNADVWLDINNNSLLDDGEPNAVTGDGGRATLQVPSDLMAHDYSVIVRARAGITIDESHGQTILSDFVMAAPPGESVITPLATLVYVVMKAGATQEQAVQQVSVSLNIPEPEVLGDFIAEESIAAEVAAANVVSSEIIPADITELLEAVVNPTELTNELEQLAEAIDELEDGELIVPDENGELVVSPDSDGDGLADIIDPTPVVPTPTPVPVNVAPVLASIEDKVTYQDTSIEVTLAASDSNNDSLTFNTSLLNNANFDVGITDDVLRITPINKYFGNEIITVSVSDGELEDSKDFTLQVLQISIPPVAQIASDEISTPPPMPTL